MKKQLPLAIAIGAGLMALVSVSTVRAEPDSPDLPDCVGCPVYSFKDTNNDGLYDTRVNVNANLSLPDTYTDFVGLWELWGPTISADDLYIVILPNFEQGKLLIGGDLWSSRFPNGDFINGVQTVYWEDTSLIKGVFGDFGDTQLDNDVTTSAYRGDAGGDYRLWSKATWNPKAIVINVDNRANVYDALHGWVWNQLRIDKPDPNPPLP